MSEIKTLYTDKALTEALYPRTKFNAVSDDDGNVLGNVASLQMVEKESGVDAVVVDALPKFMSIDNNRLLLTSNGTVDYTATECCIAIATGTVNNTTVGEGLPSVNGVTFNNQPMLYNYGSNVVVPLGVGDVFKVRINGNYGFCKIYGVKFETVRG